MNKPQPHVTTQMNPPNIRQKLDAKVHTLYNSIYIKNKRLGRAQGVEPGSGHRGSGMLAKVCFLIWGLVTYACSNGIQILPSVN